MLTAIPFEKQQCTSIKKAFLIDLIQYFHNNLSRNLVKNGTPIKILQNYQHSVENSCRTTLSNKYISYTWLVEERFVLGKIRERDSTDTHTYTPGQCQLPNNKRMTPNIKEMLKMSLQPCIACSCRIYF